MGLGRDDYRNALELTGSIYSAALDASAWPQVARDVAEFIGGSKGMIFTPTTSPKDGGFVVPHAMPESMLQQWATRYIKHDLWAQAGERKDAIHDGNVILDSDLVPEREFFDSIVYRELLEQYGIARLCCGIVFGHATPGMLFTSCSVFRAIGETRFGPAEKAKMELIVPHLSRALGVTFRLRDAEFKAATTIAALDRVTTGVLILGSRGRVMHANQSARQVLDAADGLAMPAGAGDRLVASDADTQVLIDRAIAECLEPEQLEVPHFARGVAAPRKSGNREYLLQFAPLPVVNDAPVVSLGGRTIVFIVDQDAAVHLDKGVLMKLFSLTNAEARLATLLASGNSLKTAASEEGVSEATMRTHLKHLFEKTRTGRQAELVSLLHSLASRS